MTDRYAVIGNPIAHSKSPQIHLAFARAAGQAIEYTAIEAPLSGFGATVDAFQRSGGSGVNVTVPFKEAAYQYCQRLSERARAAGVVNTLTFGGEVVGDNTDGVGLVNDLARSTGGDLKGAALLLMGAGGAAQGVIGALLDAGVARVVVANRTPGRAHALAARFRGLTACAYDALAGERFDIVVNATSAGLSGAAPALPASVLGPRVLAYEMVYGRDTPFLAMARAAGARPVDGLGMLVEQAAESFLVWRGVRPNTAQVLAQLRAI